MWVRILLPLYIFKIYKYQIPPLQQRTKRYLLKIRPIITFPKVTKWLSYHINNSVKAPNSYFWYTKGKYTQKAQLNKTSLNYYPTYVNFVFVTSIYNKINVTNQYRPKEGLGNGNYWSLFKKKKKNYNFKKSNIAYSHLIYNGNENTFYRKKIPETNYYTRTSNKTQHNQTPYTKYNTHNLKKLFVNQVKTRLTCFKLKQYLFKKFCKKIDKKSKVLWNNKYTCPNNAKTIIKFNSNAYCPIFKGNNMYTKQLLGPSVSRLQPTNWYKNNSKNFFVTKQIHLLFTPLDNFIKFLNSKTVFTLLNNLKLRYMSRYYIVFSSVYQQKLSLHLLDQLLRQVHYTNINTHKLLKKPLIKGPDKVKFILSPWYNTCYKKRLNNINVYSLSINNFYNNHANTFTPTPFPANQTFRYQKGTPQNNIYPAMTTLCLSLFLKNYQTTKLLKKLPPQYTSNHKLRSSKHWLSTSSKQSPAITYATTFFISKFFLKNKILYKYLLRNVKLSINQDCNFPTNPKGPATYYYSRKVINLQRYFLKKLSYNNFTQTKKYRKVYHTGNNFYKKPQNSINPLNQTKLAKSLWYKVSSPLTKGIKNNPLISQKQIQVFKSTRCSNFYWSRPFLLTKKLKYRPYTKPNPSSNNNKIYLNVVNLKTFFFENTFKNLLLNKHFFKRKKYFYLKKQTDTAPYYQRYSLRLNNNLTKYLVPTNTILNKLTITKITQLFTGTDKSMLTSVNSSTRSLTFNNMRSQMLNPALSLWLINDPFLFKFLLMTPNIPITPKYRTTVKNKLTQSCLQSRTINKYNNNLIPHKLFSYTILKKVHTSFVQNKLLINIIPIYHSTLVRFMEHASGCQILIQFYTFVNQSVATTHIINYKLWIPRLTFYERRLGHKFFLEESIHILHLGFVLKDPTLILKWLKAIILRISFWRTRSIFRFLKYLMLNFYSQIFVKLGIKGFRIKLKGKISAAGNSRKRLILYRVGQTSHSTLKLRVLSEFDTVITFTGVMGLTVSIFY